MRPKSKFKQKSGKLVKELRSIFLTKTMIISKALLEKILNNLTISLGFGLIHLMISESMQNINFVITSKIDVTESLIVEIRHIGGAVIGIDASVVSKEKI